MTKWLKEDKPKCDTCGVAKKQPRPIRKIRDKLPQFYNLIREGYSPGYAAKLAGFNLEGFRKRLLEEPEFKELNDNYKEKILHKKAK